MGLIRCLDCDRQVSYNADCCPNCGNKRFREQWAAREERWKKEGEEALKQEKQKAKELGYANIEEYRLAKEREKLNKERLDWLLKATGIIIGTAIGWYFFFHLNILSSK